MTFFATHFHELTRLEKHEAETLASGGKHSIFNLHVTADTTSSAITMLHEVQEGSCDRSFGLHVAQLARFPRAVLDDAARKAHLLEQLTVVQTPAAADADADADAPAAKRQRLDGAGASASKEAERESNLALLRKFASIPEAELTTAPGVARVRALILGSSGAAN